MRDVEPDDDAASGHDGARDAEMADETLTVESLDPAGDSAARRRRLAGWLSARLATGPGRRLSTRARALRVAVVVTLVVATLFALLDGGALVGVGWGRLTAALRGEPAVPPLAMTGWRMIDAAPTPLDATVTYTPDPLDPATVYACTADSSSVQVWQTSSSGQAWLNTLTVSPSPPARSCRVKVASDAPAVGLVVIHARDPNSPGCERLTLYRGAGGARWSPVSLPSIRGACLGDVWPSAHTLYYWWTNAQGGQALTGLARSDDLGGDDLGKTWLPVPLFPSDPRFSLAPALLDSGSANTIMTQVYMWPAPGQGEARNEVWRSLDGGFSWQQAPNAPLGAQLFTTTEPGALMDVRWPPTYAAVFNGGELAPPWVPDHAPATIEALQPNGSAWTKLPPLPLAPSQTPQNPPPLGISAALAVGPGGDLLALGQKSGAAATLNPQRELWLWAWDPAIHKWRAGTMTPAGASLAGITWATGPAGGPYAKAPGAYLWLTADANGRQTLFSTFISSAQE